MCKLRSGQIGISDLDEGTLKRAIYAYSWISLDCHHQSIQEKPRQKGRSILRYFILPFLESRLRFSLERLAGSGYALGRQTQVRPACAFKRHSSLISLKLGTTPPEQIFSLFFRRFPPLRRGPAELSDDEFRSKSSSSKAVSGFSPF